MRGVSSPSNKLSYVIAVSKDIASIKDLQGKAFAVSRAGALSQYITFPFFEKAGASKDAVRWVSVGSSKDRLQALVAGRVQGAVLYLDDAFTVRDNPDIHIIATVGDELPLYPHELLLVRKDDIDKRPEKVIRIVQSIMEACRFLQTHREESIDEFVKYTNADRAIAGEVYDKLLALNAWGVDGGMTEAGLRSGMALSVQNKAIPAAVPLDQFTDLAIQAEALRRIGGPFAK